MNTPRFLIQPLRRVVIAMLLAAAAQAQTSSFTFSGKVLDPSRTPIEGAAVSAIPEGRQNGPSVISSQSGTFSIPLTAGKYTLRIAKEGFLEITQPVSIPQT